MARPPIPKFIGARVRRREDPGLITGEGRYVADIQSGNALNAVFLRSPYAHARIQSIDTAPAEKCSGVVAVLSGADLNPEVVGSLSVIAAAPCGEYERVQQPDRQLLQSERVRFMGDPVAVVVAETAAVAEDAAEQILVDYDPLPVAASLARAHLGRPGRPNRRCRRGFRFGSSGRWYAYVRYSCCPPLSVRWFVSCDGRATRAHKTVRGRRSLGHGLMTRCRAWRCPLYTRLGRSGFNRRNGMKRDFGDSRPPTRDEITEASPATLMRKWI